MIVLFTGAGGTGKTTLAKAAANAYGVKFLASSAREVQRDFGITCEDDQLDLTPAQMDDLQTRISDRYWSDACAERDHGNGYIADRTVACHFTYHVMKGWADVTPEMLARYEQRIHEQFISANLIVHCPLGQFEPPADGFRTESQVQRVVFDRLIRGTIDCLRGEINIMSMTVSDRKTRARHLRSALLNVGAIAPEDEEESRLVRH